MPVALSQMRAVVTTEDADPELVDRLMRFRRDLFVLKLGWNLPSGDADRERDQFDTPDAVHVALLTGDEVIGGFRAIRADKQYLARSLFPGLATTIPYPHTADAWEISRFGVQQGAGLLAARVNYSLMFYFARTRNARALVALADLPYERFLWRIGARTRRYGPPQRIDTDAAGRPVVVIAGDLLVAAQGGPRFEAIASLVQDMEITDAALVLGRRRLSA